ncbi:MAG: extracellular solute-binding protein [Streptosporangiaceae bacterium]|nr:extracellular solute-binding protein [Streptosporangiaceae bacterium]MBV9855369.1 extracellular solute-binding protein [Streptosporangiaceae bacterium]
MRKTSLLSASLAAAVTLAAGACSSGGSAGGGGATTLKIITWVNPPAVSAINAIDAEFHKKYPNITVKLQTAVNVNGPYETLLQQTVDSGGADIVTSVTQLQPLPLNPNRNNETPLQFWSTSGAFAPLNGQSFLTDYQPSALAAETYNGKVYGLVSGTYQEGVFYDKQTFAKYHLTVPTTYSQFLAVCQTLKSRGVTPLFTALGNVGPVYMQFLYYEAMIDLWYPHAPGGNLATALEKGTAKWTDPNFIQGMNEEKAVAQYLEPNYTGVPWESMPGDFAKGKGAMLLDGSWDLSAVQQANPSMQVGFFPLPFSNVAADNKPYLADDLTFEVLNSSPNKAAAMKWLQFFSSPSVYAQYVNTTGISSSQNSGTFSGYSAKALGSWFGQGVNRNVFYPVLSPNNGYYDQETYWPYLQLAVVQGSKTPAQAAATYQQDWKAP